jgi:isocitrate dehydrogenase kinase/phosphatase
MSEIQFDPIDGEPPSINSRQISWGDPYAFKGDDDYYKLVENLLNQQTRQDAQNDRIATAAALDRRASLIASGVLKGSTQPLQIVSRSDEVLAEAGELSMMSRLTAYTEQALAQYRSGATVHTAEDVRKDTALCGSARLTKAIYPERHADARTAPPVTYVYYPDQSDKTVLYMWLSDTPRVIDSQNQSVSVQNIMERIQATFPVVERPRPRVRQISQLLSVFGIRRPVI